jgi:hypothetical protein
VSDKTALPDELADGDRVERAVTLIQHMLLNDEVYHAHKENMANAGIAVMLALLGSIIALQAWPDADWIPTIFVPKRGTAFIGFFVLWFLIHLFVRWQLRNRRFAATRQAAALRALTLWTLRAPKASDITLPDVAVLTPTAPRERPLALLDWLLPYPPRIPSTDAGRGDYPPWFADEIQRQELSRTGVLTGEWLLTLGSYFVLFVAAVRTFGAP